MIEEDLNNDKGYFNSLKRKKEIHEKQLIRLHKSGKFVELTKKCIDKYKSDKYIDKWYNLGYEPPCNLYYFLHDYAKKYGRVLDNEELKQYANIFTTSIYYCEGYYFNLMIGQGSTILITEKLI